MLYAGLDLGQRQDHSAIAVVERNDLYRAYETPTFHSLIVRHLERAPLGTPYPLVVTRVKAVVRAGLLEGGCSLAVDATGVGAPVVDMLRAAAARLRSNRRLDNRWRSRAAVARRMDCTKEGPAGRPTGASGTGRTPDRA